MSETAVLADHIDDRIDAILELWRKTVQSNGNVPNSTRLTRREFLDHIPELLERLADRLRGHEVDAASSAQKHGQLRWKEGYEISEVVNELSHLRLTLIRV